MSVKARYFFGKNNFLIHCLVPYLMGTVLFNKRSGITKNCHFCSRPLSRPSEDLFSHCFECNSQRLEQMTLDYDPCPVCNKRNNTK